MMKLGQMNQNVLKSSAIIYQNIVKLVRNKGTVNLIVR